MEIGSSPISSRNMAPSSASSNLPGRLQSNYGEFAIKIVLNRITEIGSKVFSRKMAKINVLEKKIQLYSANKEDFISLTDIAKHKNPDEPRFIIQNWMRTRFTMVFLGI